MTSGPLRQEFGTQATDAVAALGAEVTVELITSNVVLRVIEEAGHDRR